jgi:hypothetical protein
VRMQRLCYFASRTLRNGASLHKTGRRQSTSMTSAVHNISGGTSKDVVVVYVTVPSRDEGALVVVFEGRSQSLDRL